MIAIIPNPPPLITPLYINTPHSSFASPLRSSNGRRRSRSRRFQARASSLVLPLLPFPIDQVLIPSEVKTLHLYEARYIALLEESLYKKNKVFVHFVLDPVGFGGTSLEASFAARYGCLVIIEKVEQLDIGALVLIRGVGRVKVLEFKQIKYEFLADERSRRETFKKRKSGLFKKLNELKTLCNVDACAIVINEDGTQSEVWPSMHATSQVVHRFLNMPSSSQTTNTVGQSGFLRQNLSRISKNLEKETRKVQALEKELLLAECLSKEEVDVSNSDELHEMLRLLERKIGIVDRKIADIGPSTRAKGRNREVYHGKGKQPL